MRKFYSTILKIYFKNTYWNTCVFLYYTVRNNINKIFFYFGVT